MVNENVADPPTEVDWSCGYTLKPTAVHELVVIFNATSSILKIVLLAPSVVVLNDKSVLLPL